MLSDRARLAKVFADSIDEVPSPAGLEVVIIKVVHPEISYWC